MLATRYQQLVDIVIYVIRERRQSFTYGKIIQNIRRTLARARRERIDPASDETSRQMESRKFRSKFRLFRNSTKWSITLSDSGNPHREFEESAQRTPRGSSLDKWLELSNANVFSLAIARIRGMQRTWLALWTRLGRESMMRAFPWTVFVHLFRFTLSVTGLERK